MTEEWRSLARFPGYEISSEGRLRSVDSYREYHYIDKIVRQFRKGKIRRPSVKTCNGKPNALFVKLMNADHKKEYVHISHLVLIAFKGLRPDGTEACHEDDDIFNNRPSNLRWDTHAGNMADMSRRGRHRSPQKGEGHWKAILNSEDVRAIRAARRAKVPFKVLVERYGVSLPAVEAIAYGKNWKGVQ